MYTHTAQATSAVADNSGNLVWRASPVHDAVSKCAVRPRREHMRPSPFHRTISSISQHLHRSISIVSVSATASPPPQHHLRASGWGALNPVLALSGLLSWWTSTTPSARSSRAPTRLYTPFWLVRYIACYCACKRRESDLAHSSRFSPTAEMAPSDSCTLNVAHPWHMCAGTTGFIVKCGLRTGWTTKSASSAAGQESFAQLGSCHREAVPWKGSAMERQCRPFHLLIRA